MNYIMKLQNFILILNKAIIVDLYVIYTNQQNIHILVALRVFRIISQFTARQPANLPNGSISKSNFSYTAAFPKQQHSQPQPAQANRPSGFFRRAPRTRGFISPPPPLSAAAPTLTTATVTGAAKISTSHSSTRRSESRARGGGGGGADDGGHAVAAG
jgi:hypothetical protein